VCRNSTCGKEGRRSLEKETKLRTSTNPPAFNEGKGKETTESPENGPRSNEERVIPERRKKIAEQHSEVVAPLLGDEKKTAAPKTEKEKTMIQGCKKKRDKNADRPNITVAQNHANSDRQAKQTPYLLVARHRGWDKRKCFFEKDHRSKAVNGKRKKQ